jgi:hypothetical protein
MLLAAPPTASMLDEQFTFIPFILDLCVLMLSPIENKYFNLYLETKWTNVVRHNNTNLTLKVQNLGFKFFWKSVKFEFGAELLKLTCERWQHSRAG